MDPTRFDHERYRERIGQGYNLNTLCKTEHIDGIYLGWVIAKAHRRRLQKQPMDSFIRKLQNIYAKVVKKFDRAVCFCRIM